MSIIDFITCYSALIAAAPEGEVQTPEDFSYPSSARWAGPIGMEGEVTGDGRLIEQNGLRWDISEENPASFRHVIEDVGAHMGATVVGRVLSVERRPGGVIWGEGDFDMGSDAGREAFRQVSLGLTTGVSMDLDDVSFEVRVAKDLLEVEEDEEGLILASGNTGELAEGDEEREHETVVEMKSDDELMVTMDARIRTATLVAVPAFEGARISIISEEDEEENEAIIPSANAVVAGGGPIAPPQSWFSAPELDGPTPLTIDEDGRVYGHLATWDVCHIASPAGEGVCVMAPHSMMNYGRFHTGTLKTKEGITLSTGKITMGTGHAALNVRAQAAAAHYDNTGTAVADIRAGEDAYGIWVAGALRPNLSAAKIRTLRASPLSGDWRAVNGNLEMHAALAVNVPGFPIPRPAGLVASGDLNALVAAGMLAPKRVLRLNNETGELLSSSDLSYLKRLANREREAVRDELATRVRLSAAKMKVRAFANTK